MKALKPALRGLSVAFTRPGAAVLPTTRANGPMLWVIAIMASFMVLIAGASLALSNFAAVARGGLERGLTVQIVAANPAARSAQTSAAAALLARQPDINEVRVVPETELASLVEPWLGGAARSDAITLPALIDATLAGPPDGALIDRLRRELSRVAPAARLSLQAEWLGPVFDAIRALQLLSFIVMALLILGSAAAVWLAARNSLDANRETIEIVHHLGGNDPQIAAIFQRAVLRDAAIGSLIGLACGSAALLLLGGRFAALQSGMMKSGSLAPLDWLVIGLVPVVMTAVAVATARRTVLAQLGRML